MCFTHKLFNVTHGANIICKHIVESWMWWHMPVTPVCWDVEARKSGFQT